MLPCIGPGMCCGKSEYLEHEQAVELTPLRYPDITSDREPEKRRGSRCFPTCLGVCCVLILLAGLLLLVSMLSLFGPSGSGHLLKGEFNTVASAPFGAHGVPLSRTFSGFWNLADPPNEVSITRWQQIQDLGAQFPYKEWSGEWWRGNEAGFLVFNPFFWEGTGTDPAGLALGMNPEQHAAVRPLLEQLFGDPGSAKEDLQALIAEFLQNRKAAGSLEVMEDLQVLVHQILHRVTFGKDIAYEDAREFVAVQNNLLEYGVTTEALPKHLYPVIGRLMGIYTLQERVTAYVQTYGNYLIERFGSKLEHLDCAPSLNCTVQLASVVFDTFFAVGSAPLTEALGTGIGLLYSMDSSNPVMTETNDTSSFVRGKEEQFFLEVLRYFPPVVGIPHWEEAPPCLPGEGGRRLANTSETQEGQPKEESTTTEAEAATTSTSKHSSSPKNATSTGSSKRAEEADETTTEALSSTTELASTTGATTETPISTSSSVPLVAGKSECLGAAWMELQRSHPDKKNQQWGYGKRIVMNLASAQKATEVWGESADRFLLRPTTAYQEKSVGFGEMLVDNSVEGGRMNRDCPGKQLAVLIGKSFFEIFNQSAWRPSTTGIDFRPKPTKISMGAFTLHPVSPGNQSDLVV